jgi:hypothetical protein
MFLNLLLWSARLTGWMDEARRQMGRGIDALGWGPQQAPFVVAAEFQGARLKPYALGWASKGLSSSSFQPVQAELHPHTNRKPQLPP